MEYCVDRALKTCLHYLIGTIHVQPYSYSIVIILMLGPTPQVSFTVNFIHYALLAFAEQNANSQLINAH